VDGGRNSLSPRGPLIYHQTSHFTDVNDNSDSDYDLFISYAHKDAAEIVPQLVRELEAMGLDVW
jgi:hypothetical protein